MKIQYAFNFLIAQLLLFTPHLVSAENSTTILGDMLRNSNSLSSNLSIEKRIEVFESIQRDAQKILDEHPSSNEAILFLSGQKIGNFDLIAIQQKYIDELAGLYNSTCVFEPSAECLAYVALKMGSESCKRAQNFEDIASAQSKIKSAIRIFSKSDESTQIKNLALAEFRNCATASSSINRDALNDYFLSQLVPIYLEIGEEDQARAIIQQIDDPYLTFVSVIELTKFNEGVNRDFLRRMKEYVNAKNIRGGNKVLSGLDLALLGLEAGVDPTTEAFYNFNAGGQCESDTTGILILNKTVDYVERLSDFQQGQSFLNNLAKLDGAVRYLQFFCASPELSEAMAGYIYFRTASKSLADQYLVSAKTSNFDSKIMQDIAFKLFVENEFFEIKNRFPSLSKVGGTQALRMGRQLSTKFSYPFSDYAALKISMLDGDLCASVETLFKDYITNSSASANEVSGLVDFALSTSLLDSGEACGDASLELLLK